MNMDYNTLGSVMTVVMLVVFLAIVAWACSSKRSAQFDAAARVPFEEDAESTPPPAGARPGESA